MKPNYKFLRVVLGSTVGAVLWAGCASEPCASDRHVVMNEPAGAQCVQTKPSALDWQQDLTNWRADTHPERRTGWDMVFANNPSYSIVNQLPIIVDPSGASPQER